MRFVIAVIVAGIGIKLGVDLAAYAEADDAPGGVVAGALLIMGSAVLGLVIAMRCRQN